MCRFNASPIRRPFCGMWASVEAMLVFLFLIMVMMPVLNYTHFITVSASERAVSQARLARALAEADFLYAHGASARPGDPAGVPLVRLGQFDEAQFLQYPATASALDFRPKTVEKFIYYGPSGIPPLDSPDKICVPRLMSENNLPVRVYVCLAA